MGFLKCNYNLIINENGNIQYILKRDNEKEQTF